MSESRHPADGLAGCPRPAPDSFVIHLLGGSGAEVMVEARLRREWMEVWFAGQLRAVLGCQALKTWFDLPGRRAVGRGRGVDGLGHRADQSHAGRCRRLAGARPCLGWPACPSLTTSDEGEAPSLSVPCPAVKPSTEGCRLMSEVRPLAIAVIRHRCAGDERADRRTLAAVETYAAVEGYAVTQLLQCFGRSRIDAADVDLLLDLAERVEAQAVLTFGEIDEQILRSIAVRSTLRVLPVPHGLLPIPTRSPASSPRTTATPASVHTSALGTATSPAGLAIADNLPARRVVEPAPPVWTGRLELDLINERGWRVDVVEVVVRIDSVTLWSANRTLAVMDRDHFRGWLTQRPEEPFGIDDVTWSQQKPSRNSWS
jgi:hypothetical protein